MDHRRWLVLVIFSVVVIFQPASLFGKSTSGFLDRDSTIRREVSLQTGLIRIQSPDVIRANPDFDVRFHFRPVLIVNYQLQLSERWWVGNYIGYGELRTDLFIKESHLPDFHTRLGIIAQGDYLDVGSYYAYRMTLVNSWIFQGKIGYTIFFNLGKDHYERIQDGSRADLTSYAEIREVSDAPRSRFSLSSFVEAQVGRNFGRHSFCLSMAYQRFGSRGGLPPANFFRRKYEIHTGNNKVHSVNLTHRVSNAYRIELVYCFRLKSA